MSFHELYKISKYKIHERHKHTQLDINETPYNTYKKQYKCLPNVILLRF